MGNKSGRIKSGVRASPEFSPKANSVSNVGSPQSIDAISSRRSSRSWCISPRAKDAPRPVECATARQQSNSASIRRTKSTENGIVIANFESIELPDDRFGMSPPGPNLKRFSSSPTSSNIKSVPTPSNRRAFDDVLQSPKLKVTEVLSPKSQQLEQFRREIDQMNLDPSKALAKLRRLRSEPAKQSTTTKKNLRQSLQFNRELEIIHGSVPVGVSDAPSESSTDASMQDLVSFHGSEGHRSMSRRRKNRSQSKKSSSRNGSTPVLVEEEDEGGDLRRSSGSGSRMKNSRHPSFVMKNENVSHKLNQKPSKVSRRSKDCKDAPKAKHRNRMSRSCSHRSRSVSRGRRPCRSLSGPRLRFPSPMRAPKTII